MKINKIYCLIILFSTITVGCKDEFIPADTLSDATWYTSETKRQGTDSLYNIKIDNFISFMDASQGAITHEWIIEEGNSFLIDQFDINNKDFNPFIDSTIGLVSTKPIVHVLFKKQGRNKIILRNTFKEYVRFVGKDTTYESIQEGDHWKFERVFYVEVYDSMKPAFEIRDEAGVVYKKVLQDEIVNPADSISWPLINVNIGDKLFFADLTTYDRPNTRTWTVPGSTLGTSNDSIASFEFLRMGTYTGMSITSKRNRLGIPASEIKKFIPIRIKVNGTTKPYQIYSNIIQESTNSISFSTYGEVSPTSDFASAKNSFVVHVKNDSAFVDQDFPIESVSIDPKNSSRIIIKLTGNIFNTDVVTVTYNGNEIKSKDDRILQSFDNKLVNMKFDKFYFNTLWGGFETMGTDSFVEGWQIVYTNTEKFFKQSNEQVSSGMYSLLVEGQRSQVVTASLPIVTKSTNIASLNTGIRYLVRFKIWVDPTVTNTIDNMNVEFAYIDDMGGVTPVSTKLTYTFPAEKGKWITMQQIMSFTADQAGVFEKNKSKLHMLFRLSRTRIKSDFKFFIDDVEMFSGVQDRN